MVQPKLVNGSQTNNLYSANYWLLLYKDWFILIGLIALFIGVLLMVDNQYLMSLAVIVMIDTLAALGLAPLIRSGDTSFASGALNAIGAYITAFLAINAGLSLLAAIPIAIIGSGIVAWILSLLVLRLEGYYLALGTLVFNLIIISLFLNIPGLGGVDGIAGIPDFQVGGLVVNSNSGSLIFAAVVLVIISFILFPLLHRGVVGTFLDTIRESNVLVRSLGREPNKSKQFLFIVSGCVSGLAGVIYASYLNYISPVPFGIMLSAHILLIAVVGGTGAIYGPFLGAIVLFAVDQVAVSGLELMIGTSGVGLARYIVYGLLLVLVIILLPRGLTGLLLRPKKSDEPVVTQYRSEVDDGKVETGKC